MTIKQLHGIKWLRDYQNEIHNSVGIMFTGEERNKYNKLWQQYVDINDILTEYDLPKIDLPDEKDYPIALDYYIEKSNESYTMWYKRNYDEFRRMMKATETKIESYINMIKGVM